MACVDDPHSCCPFAHTEESEMASNYGCLPDPYAIVNMRLHHGKTWACHSYPDQPCAGAIRHLRDLGVPYKVIDPELLTERSPWHLYAEPKTGDEKMLKYHDDNFERTSRTLRDRDHPNDWVVEYFPDRRLLPSMWRAVRGGAARLVRLARLGLKKISERIE